MSDRFVASLTLPARIQSVRVAASFLVEAARSFAVPIVDNQLFEVAIVEALNNAVQHNPRDGASNLHCELEVAGHRLTVRVLDEGMRVPVVLTLPAAAVPVPDPSGERLESIPHDGYGLYLIRAVFPDVRPVTKDGCHGVELQLSY